MANISDAFGTIDFSAKSIDDIKLLLSLFGLLEGYQYDTTLQIEDDIEEYTSEKDGIYTYTCYFNGFGRWAYECNIEYCFEWLKDDCEREKRLEDYERLKDIYFALRYDFTDVECGCQVFYHAVIDVKHETGESLEDLKPITVSEENYDFTIQNLLEYGGYDYEYALDYLGLLEGGYANDHYRYQFYCPKCKVKLEYKDGNYICPNCHQTIEPLDAEVYDLIDKDFI